MCPASSEMILNRAVNVQFHIKIVTGRSYFQKADSGLLVPQNKQVVILKTVTASTLSRQNVLTGMPLASCNSMPSPICVRGHSAFPDFIVTLPRLPHTT
jgi:hypothetical protein